MLECVPGRSRAAITRRLTIPTIGIGAGPDTDGQVLVFHDLLGMRPASEFSPKFVKRFAEVGDVIAEGVTAYADQVRTRRFPDQAHTFAMPPEEVSAFEAAISGETSDENVLADW